MKYNLSEITELIKARRTIVPEKYSKRKVHREIVEHVLNNALWAPTHGLTQPWFFKVFTGNGLVELGKTQARLYKNATEPSLFLQAKYDKYLNRPALSSVVIAVCMKRQETGKIPEIEEIEAVACAVQNMHLTCTAYGLGGFWSTGGPTYTDEMKNYLGLGEKDRCLGFFYMGYPEGEWPRGQRTPLEYKCDWIDG